MSAIDRCKKIMTLVDVYAEKKSSNTRHDLRVALMDAIAPPVAAGSVDTEEFRKVTFAYAHAIVNGSVPESSIAWGRVVAVADSWGAQQREAGRLEELARIQDLERAREQFREV